MSEYLKIPYFCLHHFYASNSVLILPGAPVLCLFKYVVLTFLNRSDKFVDIHIETCIHKNLYKHIVTHQFLERNFSAVFVNVY